MPERAPWLDLTLAAIPVILAPLVGAFIARRGENRRASELDALQRRVELVDRLRTLRTVLPKDIGDPLSREIDDILADLEALRLQEIVAIPQPGKDKSRFASLFLSYRQASRKGGIYKILFYLFTGLGVLALIASLDALLTGEQDRFVIVAGALFYVAVGLAFRSAAVRDYTHHSEKQRLGGGHTGTGSSS